MFKLDGLLCDLEPETMRRLADQLHRQQVMLLERAAWREAQQQRRRELERRKIPLSPAQLRELQREARNLEIVRAAWSGMTTRALAARYGLSPSRIRAIIREEREERIRRGADVCRMCRGALDAMVELMTAGEPSKSRAERPQPV